MGKLTLDKAVNSSIAYIPGNAIGGDSRELTRLVRECHPQIKFGLHDGSLTYTLLLKRGGADILRFAHGGTDLRFSRFDLKGRVDLSVDPATIYGRLLSDADAVKRDIEADILHGIAKVIAEGAGRVTLSVSQPSSERYTRLRLQVWAGPRSPQFFADFDISPEEIKSLSGALAEA